MDLKCGNWVQDHARGLSRGYEVFSQDRKVQFFLLGGGKKPKR